MEFSSPIFHPAIVRNVFRVLQVAVLVQLIKDQQKDEKDGTFRPPKGFPFAEAARNGRLPPQLLTHSLGAFPQRPSR